MKLHTKDGSITLGGRIFLPEIKDSEFELDESDIKIELVDINQVSWSQYGRYVKITAPVFVTRYYPVDNES